MSNEINEKNKTPLTEEQLEHAAGGKLSAGCRFVHKSGNIRKRQGGKYDGHHEAECNSTCFIFPLNCRCHNEAEICVNRWHIVTENGSPLPRNDDHENWYA